MPHARYSKQLAMILALAGMASSLQSGTPSRTTRPNQPDVYLITIDTLRTDHVHCFGGNSAETPALDSLAHDGIRFTQAVTPSPITNTSHASILTGKYPSSHGVTDFGIHLKSSVSTWAELLKAHGYHTAAFIGAAILDSRSLAPGFDRGFAYYDNFDPSLPNSQHWDRLERRGEVVVQHAEAWMKTHPQHPRFVWVHLYDPHDPYEPPEPFATRYKDHLYDGEIAYADQALGNLLQWLKSKDRYLSSVVFVTGDHGEGLGEHGEDTHGIFLYDTTVRVPVILKLPGDKNAGETISSQVRTIDLLPTVLDALQIGTTAVFDGSSLLPLMQHKKKEGDRIALGETDYPIRFGWAPLRFVRSEQFKYIDAPHPELYDLRSDSRENSNVYEPWNPTVRDLRGHLAEYLASEAGPLKGTAPVSERTIQELHALGYFPKSAGETSVGQPSLLPDPKDKIQIQNLLHRAMIQHESGNVDRAMAALQNALEQDPDSVFTLAQLGELELQSGDIKAAVKHLQRASDLHASNPELDFTLGKALEKMGNLKSARDVLERSLRSSPESFQARLLLAKVYRELGAPKDAADQLEGAIFLEPNNAEPRLELAKIWLDQGKYHDALKQLRQAEALDRTNPAVFGMLAQAYGKTGQDDQARAAQQKAEQLKAKK